jgi:hypothetical protein
MAMPTFEKTYYNLIESNFWTKVFPNVCHKFRDIELGGIDIINSVERVADMLIIGPYSADTRIIFEQSMTNIIIWLKIILQDTDTRSVFIEKLKKEYCKVYKNINVKIPDFIIDYINTYSKTFSSSS